MTKDQNKTNFRQEGQNFGNFRKVRPVQSHLLTGLVFRVLILNINNINYLKEKKMSCEILVFTFNYQAGVEYQMHEIFTHPKVSQLCFLLKETNALQANQSIPKCRNVGGLQKVTLLKKNKRMRK